MVEPGATTGRLHFMKDQVLCPSDWIHPLPDGAEKPAAGVDFHARALPYFSCLSARDLSFADPCQTFALPFMLQPALPNEEPRQAAHKARRSQARHGNE